MKTVVRYWQIALAAVILASSLDCTRSESDALTWSFTNNSSALCNDFTRAGFFHRNASDASGEGRWVVFLESGSFCYSNETCNRRYFLPRVRDMYNRGSGRTANGGLGDFDTSHAWKDSDGEAAAKDENKNQLVNIVNPLMTSMSCYNNTGDFRDGLTLQGRDVLDRNLDSTFRSHGHVVIPYCSSDIWLGNEDESSRNYSQKRSIGNHEYCDCWNASCFTYDPKYTGLQFTFRGKTIFQSVIRTLDEMYNLRGSGAKEIVLMGSSAGGLGVLNLAKWVQDQYPHLEMKAVVDSAWFINFHDGINQQFDILRLKEAEKDKEEKPSPSSLPPPTPSTPSDLPPSSSPTISSYLTPSPTSLPDDNPPSSSPTISSYLAPSPTSLPDDDQTYSGSGSGSGSGEDGDFKRSATLEEIVNEMSSRGKREVISDLLSLMESHEACQDTRQGFPCCLSTQCLLSESNPTTKEPYFPHDIPLFVITSLYDIFILAPSLVNVGLFQSDSSRSTAGLALDFLTTVGEYGGAMNSSLKDIESMQRANFSFYASQCFQHIYFASSTLWGKGSLFGTDPIIVEPEIATFR